jgi:hypothetical protein
LAKAPRCGAAAVFRNSKWVWWLMGSQLPGADNPQLPIEGHGKKRTSRWVIGRLECQKKAGTMEATDESRFV